MDVSREAPDVATQPKFHDLTTVLVPFCVDLKEGALVRGMGVNLLGHGVSSRPWGIKLFMMISTSYRLS